MYSRYRDGGEGYRICVFLPIIHRAREVNREGGGRGFARSRVYYMQPPLSSSIRRAKSMTCDMHSECRVPQNIHDTKRKTKKKIEHRTPQALPWVNQKVNMTKCGMPRELIPLAARWFCSARRLEHNTHVFTQKPRFLLYAYQDIRKLLNEQCCWRVDIRLGLTLT